MRTRTRNSSALLLALALACTGSKGASDQRTLGQGDHGGPSGPGAEAARPAPAVVPAAPDLRLWKPEGTPVAPTRYRAELTVDPESPTFRGRIQIEVAVARPVDQIWLNATELKVSGVSLTVGGELWPVQVFDVASEDFIGFSTGKALPPGPALIELAYEGAMSDKDSTGLFRQKDDDGRWYVYSHMEPLSARTVFPCFDEPAFKVPWQLTLNVKSDHMALTNTPETGSAALRDPGWKSVSFAESPPLPSYLVAVAVGPFDAVDIGKIGRNQTPARVIVPKGRGAEAGFAVAATPALLDRLEAYFDRPYPYAKLDSIAVLRFGGAMENPGLITYGQSLLLAKKGEETVGFKRAYAGVGAHELAHQWFGNLVTLAWWDDIWLNESFATWMGNKVVDQWKPDWDGAVDAVEEADGSMYSDSLTTARKIRQPIRSKHDIVGAFDAITYGKGGAVLTMFEQWVGEDTFRDGVRAYLDKHAWSTATAADFLAAVAAASRPEVARAFDTFLEQSGVPLVSVELSCAKDAPPALSLSQERFLPMGSKGSAEQKWEFPVCVEYGDARTTHEQCALMTEQTARIELSHARGCPTWVLANADASGYYRVAYAEGMLSALFGAAAKRLSVAERVSVINDTAALVATGKVSIAEAMGLVPALVKERDHNIVRSAAGIAGLRRDLVPAELRPNYARFIRKMFGARARKLGWTHRAGDSDEVKQLRNVLVPMVASAGEDQTLRAQAVALADKWIASRQGVDRDMISDVITMAAREGGAAMHARFAKALETEKKQDDRRRLLQGMAATTDPALVEKNLQLYLTSDMDIRETGALLQVPLWREETRQLTYDFLKANYDAVLAKIPREYQAFMLFMAGAFCDEAHLADAKAFFGPRAAASLGGPKIYAQTIERVELCIAYRSAQQPDIAKFLARY